MSIPSSDSSAPASEGTADASDIRGLKPLEAFAYPSWYYVGGVVLFLLMAGAVIVALSRWLKRRRQKPAMPPVPPEPLHLIILKRLEAVRKNLPSDYLQRRYFDVSEIFRDYLEGRFGFPASDWTTEEIVHYVMARSESAADRNDTVITILTQLDEVKFAGRKPEISDLFNLIDQVERFVSS